jgi:CspA family cold shock protein
MMQGKVLWFSDSRGFGFIEQEGGEDLFVHWKAIVSSDKRKRLREGQQVEYQIGKGAKGIQAENVRPV